MRPFFNLAREKSLSRSATLARRTQRNTFLACLQFGREFCEGDSIDAFGFVGPIGTVPAEMPFIPVSFGSVFHVRTAGWFYPGQDSVGKAKTWWRMVEQSFHA